MFDCVQVVFSAQVGSSDCVYVVSRPPWKVETQKEKELNLGVGGTRIVRLLVCTLCLVVCSLCLVVCSLCFFVCSTGADIHRSVAVCVYCVFCVSCV